MRAVRHALEKKNPNTPPKKQIIVSTVVEKIVK
jgi:hypothetical protein